VAANSNWFVLLAMDWTFVCLIIIYADIMGLLGQMPVV